MTAIAIDGRLIRTFAEREPKALPWEDLGVEVVIESTGLFRSRVRRRTASRGRRAQGDHLRAGERI